MPPSPGRPSATTEPFPGSETSAGAGLLPGSGTNTSASTTTNVPSPPPRKTSVSRTGPRQQHVPAQPSALRHSEVLSASPEDIPARAIAQDHASTPPPSRDYVTIAGTLSDTTARPHPTRAYGSIDTIDSRGAWMTMPGLMSPSPMGPDNDTASISQLSATWLSSQPSNPAPNKRKMYFLYYVPVANWIRQYRWHYVKGDLIAALTMASFYIPMSLSYAANLGHIPPINGLYSFVFQPFVYAILGTCPQMIVGPEAAGSLLTGQVVRENIKAGHFADADHAATARIAGAVTGLSGAIILLAGLCRLGFLDSVLSRPFLRGFISSIGIVILVDQLIPEMGLDALAAHSGSAAHGSSLQKLMFLIRNGDQAHALTCAVSFGAFAVCMVCREVKKRLQPRMPGVAYIPDRFFIVAMSAIFSWAYEWDTRGLDILGDISAEGKPFKVHFPLRPSFLDRVSDAFSTAFLIALLGFFESSVAAKSLGQTLARSVSSADKSDRTDEDDEEADKEAGLNVVLSTNRELVALGCANLLGGLFMSLPAFGGYGRSKVNASTGGRTPMSSVFLSFFTIICTLFLLPYFYYIPKGVLSAMISVVAYSLIEEAPHDIAFFWMISGYNELILMLLIILTTIFWNLRIGMAVGIGLSLLRLLRHSTRPRIQILGRVPGSNPPRFANAEDPSSSSTDGSSALEFFARSLIVRIPEPLTFANTGSLKDRLRRLEEYGSNGAHPSAPRVRGVRENKNVIFDVHGVTGLDPAAAQVLLEIVADYGRRGVRVWFCRVPGRAVMSAGGAGNAAATSGFGTLDGSGSGYAAGTSALGLGLPTDTANGLSSVNAHVHPNRTRSSTTRGRSSTTSMSEVWRLMLVSGVVAAAGGEAHFVSTVQDALDLTEKHGDAGPDGCGALNSSGRVASSDAGYRAGGGRDEERPLLGSYSNRSSGREAV